MSDSKNYENIYLNDLTKPNKHCAYYKKLLVEELALTTEFMKFYHGNCSVIGKIRNDQGNVYLDNIKLTCLEQKYRYSEGRVSIKIIDNIYFGHLPNGKTAEIFGKSVLYDKIDIPANQIPITSNDLNTRWFEFIKNKVDAKNLEKEFNYKLLEKYEPAIQIHFMNLVDSPNELVECNLQIRILCNDFN